MAGGLQLESSGVTDLRQKFYELLLQFSTFPAAQNFFLVQIHKLPGYVLEANVDELGLRPGTGQSTGLNLAKKQVFEPFFGGGNNWMFLATGVDLTTETTSVNNKGTLINGLLPVGPFMESREFPDNDLSIQFSETNVSIIDSIFRSWVQLYSVYGNMGDVPLSTDVSIYFISKQTNSADDDTPSITKIYTYKDCIPYVIKDANVAEYDGDTKMSSVAVGWRFSKYDVRIPVRGANLAKGIMEDFMPIPSTEHEIPILGGDVFRTKITKEEWTPGTEKYKKYEPSPQKPVMDETEIAQEQYTRNELGRIDHEAKLEEKQTPAKQRPDISYGPHAAELQTENKGGTYDLKGRTSADQEKLKQASERLTARGEDYSHLSTGEPTEPGSSGVVAQSDEQNLRLTTPRDQLLAPAEQKTQSLEEFRARDAATPTATPSFAPKRSKGGSILKELSQKNPDQANIKAAQLQVGKTLADLPGQISRQVDIFKKDPGNVANQLAKVAGDIDKFAKGTMEAAKDFGVVASIKKLDPTFQLPGDKPGHADLSVELDPKNVRTIKVAVPEKKDDDDTGDP